MPDVEHSADVSAPLPVIWDFVRDMDNWAPFLTGYQRHEKIDEDRSIWFVKGELGGLTRVAEFRVQVTEWAGPERVRFEMTGLQEPVNGSGEFIAEALGGAVPQAPPPARSGWFARLREAIARWLLHRVTSGGPRDAAPVVTAPMASRITFRLSVKAGGAAGPVMNLLLAPMLKPVAEDLATRIAGAIEAQV